eukprot:9483918-Pyramimonas_sp.AAC.1
MRGTHPLRTADASPMYGRYIVDADRPMRRPFLVGTPPRSQRCVVDASTIRGRRAPPTPIPPAIAGPTNRRGEGRLAARACAPKGGG